MIINSYSYSSDKTQNVHINDKDELFALFDEKNYTSEAWQAGIRDVPRIFITQISHNWRDNSGKMPVITKKKIF